MSADDEAEIDKQINLVQQQISLKREEKRRSKMRREELSIYIQQASQLQDALEQHYNSLVLEYSQLQDNL